MSMPPAMPKEQTRAIPVDIPHNLERVRVILVQPSHPGNIGAVARAMKGMGLRKLVLVDPVEWRSPGDAWRMAKNSREVLHDCREVESIEEALEGIQFLVGTTHRRRSEKLQEPISAREAMVQLAAASQEMQVGLLFGPENFGLSTEHLSRCHQTASVPMATKNPSLNLGQAVMIFAYELFLASLAEVTPPDWQLAEVNDMERFYDRMEQLLTRVEFKPLNGDWSTLRHAIRRAFGRLRLEQRDLATFYQIFGEIDRYLRRKIPR